MARFDMSWDEVSERVHPLTGPRMRNSLVGFKVVYKEDSSVAAHLDMVLSATDTGQRRCLRFSAPREFGWDNNEIGGWPVVIVDISDRGWEETPIVVIGDYEEGCHYFYAAAVAELETSPDTE